MNVAKMGLLPCRTRYNCVYSQKQRQEHMESNANSQKQLQIELKEETAQGIYSNLAMITHSSSEFVMDFISILPGMAKAQVKSRVIMSPEHAKRLLLALQENVLKYENSFGTIDLNRQQKGTYIPPVSDFQGQA